MYHCLVVFYVFSIMLGIMCEAFGVSMDRSVGPDCNQGAVVLVH